MSEDLQEREEIHQRQIYSFKEKESEKHSTEKLNT